MNNSTFSTSTMSSTSAVSNISNGMSNTSENQLFLYSIEVDKYTTPFTWALGFPGNIIAFTVWVQPRMRHSSGVYLAALAMTDFVFLILHILYELHEVWKVKYPIDYPVFCQAFPIVFMTSQYLAPLLVLGFTVERYISICHPFKREKFCTTKRAQIVSVCMAVFSLAINGIQGYFYVVDTKQGCKDRPEIAAEGTESFWSIWSLVTELIVFLIVPLCVLIFNVLVIREAKRLSRYEMNHLHGRSQKTSATTFMLLAVSFYLIVTTLPVTIMYVSYFYFPTGDPYADQTTDPTWIKFHRYFFSRTIIQEIGITHYALNFYIYLLTGKIFRKELKKLVMSLFCKRLPERVRTEYTSLRSSFRGSMKKTITARLSNGHAVQNGSGSGSETNL